jgi:hypothetical protein
MDSTLLNLKTHLQEYRKLDEELKALNSKIQEIRRERKGIETEMSGILSHPDYQQYDKLEIKEDGSTVKIQRPGMWTKPWSMSKGELMDALNLYFKVDKDANAEDCFTFLVEHQKPKMVATEFGFERIVKKNTILK